MSTPRPTLDYFFYPISPWTWLGHRPLMALADRFPVDIRLRPFDLAGRVFPATGGLPLGQRPPTRQAYRLVELQRWADFRGRSIHLHPAHFPVPPHDASRLLIRTLQVHGPALALQLTERVLDGVWSNEQNISDRGTLLDMATACGIDAAPLLASLEQATEAYDANTQAALDAGVFGAPWYILDGESYWGQDRLDFIERALERATAGTL